MSVILENKRGSLIMPQRSNPFSKRKLAFVDEPLSTDPHSRNPVYAYKTSLKCDFCGSRKSYSTAWKLYMHFKCHHGLDMTFVKWVIVVSAYVNVIV